MSERKCAVAVGLQAPLKNLSRLVGGSGTIASRSRKEMRAAAHLARSRYWPARPIAATTPAYLSLLRRSSLLHRRKTRPPPPAPAKRPAPSSSAAAGSLAAACSSARCRCASASALCLFQLTFLAPSVRLRLAGAPAPAPRRAPPRSRGEMRRHLRSQGRTARPTWRWAIRAPAIAARR